MRIAVSYALNMLGKKNKNFLTEQQNKISTSHFLIQALFSETES